MRSVLFAAILCLSGMNFAAEETKFQDLTVQAAERLKDGLSRQKAENDNLLQRVRVSRERSAIEAENYKTLQAWRKKCQELTIEDSKKAKQDREKWRAEHPAQIDPDTKTWLETGKSPERKVDLPPAPVLKELPALPPLDPKAKEWIESLHPIPKPEN